MQHNHYAAYATSIGRLLCIENHTCTSTQKCFITPTTNRLSILSTDNRIDKNAIKTTGIGCN